LAVQDAEQAARSGMAQAVQTAAPAAAAAGFRPAKVRVDKSPVKAKDVLAFTSELAIMLRAGLALDNALRVLIEMSYKPAVGELLKGILEAVKGGTPLSRALQAHSELFGDFYINMVRSGEASGQMSGVLDRLVEHLERQRALRESVISATIYPAILVTVAIISLVVMLGFVVPQFEKLFAEMGDALPTPTRIVMGLGKAFTQYGLVIGIAVVGLGWLAGRWLRSPAGRSWWQSRLLRMPLVGGIALKYQLTLFSRSLGTLLGNGVPMLTALHIATDTVGNVVLQQSLVRVAPIVKEGGRVVQALQSTGIFEPLAINLVRVGEETGRVGPMMLELAAILNREVETGIKRLLTLVEPVLILVLGVLIAAIIVSILMGILSVNDLAV
jgi:general secretion pathway protein F